MKTRIRFASSALLILGFIAGCAGRVSEAEPQAQDDATESLESLVRRLEHITDRDQLTREIYAAAEGTAGPEADPGVQAKLDAIAARVDELDGLFYTVETPDGTTFKFYERAPGMLHVIWKGTAELRDRYAMQDLGPIDIYRLADPEGDVPQVLLDAVARQAELAALDVFVDENIEVPEAPVETAAAEQDAFVDKHFGVVHHPPLTATQWSGHCFTHSFCQANNFGSKAWTWHDQFGADWVYVLNTADWNNPLGSVILATFDVTGDFNVDCQRYGGSDCAHLLFIRDGRKIGPLMSGLGDVIAVSTRSPLAEVPCGRRIGACPSDLQWMLSDHRANFAAGVNASWHVASRANNDWNEATQGIVQGAGHVIDLGN